MTFHKGKKLTGALFVSGIISLVLALISGEGGAAANTLSVLGLVLFVSGLLACIAFCRCPACNRAIIRKLFVLKDCPYCKRDLSTGLKTKKKK
ncbi:MAG: hypothetical protein FWG32_06870 [Oscillospiraceae bacterium]|nr:hypothetical protein [Oscillospiraceae bacterium]